MLVGSQMRQLGLEGIALHSVDASVLKACCVSDPVQAAWGSTASMAVPVCGVFQCEGLRGVKVVGAGRSRGWVSGNR